MFARCYLYLDKHQKKRHCLINRREARAVEFVINQTWSQNRSLDVTQVLADGARRNLKNSQEQYTKLLSNRKIEPNEKTRHIEVTHLWHGI